MRMWVYAGLMDHSRGIPNTRPSYSLPELQTVTRRQSRLGAFTPELVRTRHCAKGRDILEQSETLEWKAPYHF